MRPVKMDKGCVQKHKLLCPPDPAVKDANTAEIIISYIYLSERGIPKLCNSRKAKHFWLLFWLLQ